MAPLAGFATWRDPLGLETQGRIAGARPFEEIAATIETLLSASEG
jgi:hypothetical protein